VTAVLDINCDQIRKIQLGNDVCKNSPEWFSIALKASPSRDATNGRSGKGTSIVALEVKFRERVKTNRREGGYPVTSPSIRNESWGSEND